MESVKSIQTKDYIVQMIRNEILSGGLTAGEELAQETLATQLGVSRMPVREALQALVQEGFLRRLPNRHMQVVKMEQKQLYQTFRILAAMETEMELLLDENGKKSLIDQLKKCRDMIRESGIQAAREAETEIHRQLAVWLGNQYIGQIFGKMLEGYVTYVITSLQRNRQEVEWKLSSVLDILEMDDLGTDVLNTDGLKLDIFESGSLALKYPKDVRYQLQQANEQYFLHLAEALLQHMEEQND